MEGLWANLKDVELANRPTTTLAEVADATEQGIQRICKHQDLVLGFLAHTGLTWTHQPSTHPRNSTKEVRPSGDVITTQLTGLYARIPLQAGFFASVAVETQGDWAHDEALCHRSR